MGDIGGKIARALQLLDGALSDDGGLPLAIGPRADHGRIKEMAGEVLGGENRSGRRSSGDWESNGAGGSESV